jgi:nickel/cobalt transporter (NicO) family protein
MFCPLPQAAFAVLLVYAGVLVFSWTREQMTGMAERSLTAASYLMIGAIGLYLAWRSLRCLAGIWRPQPHVASGHDHGHDDHVHDEHCGHSHMPTPAEMSKIGGWRDGLMLVAGVAIRPCSGALLVLLLCWRIGNNMAGIMGTFAMGLGTATITILASLLAVTMREGAWASGLDRPVVRVISGGLGLVAGLVLVVTSGMLVRPYL